jgi:dihydrofolate synthase/folylpolyglutamate synthase
MNFQESYDYLVSLGNEVSAMKLGLESMIKLLHALGDPQNKYLKIQVAGTNGKGSVCAFLEAICLAAKVKTGLTTSPHLVSITERVRIDGQNISDDGFAALATRVRETAERLVADRELDTVPTYFEQVTAIALLAFAEAGIELAILETGLGGRLDATTAAKAEIALITRIDYDHQEYLGETIEQIAAEKAAIVHSGSIVIIGEQSPEALKVVVDRCSVFGITPRFAVDVKTDCAECSPNFKTEKDQYPVSKLGLLGRHQVENAKIAILAAEAISERFPLSPQHIIDGLSNPRHPGRLEFLSRYLFDGAHNPGGATALRKFLEQEIHTPITMIFGAMNDKDIAQIGEILFPKADILILTEAKNSRSAKVHELAKMVSNGTKVIKTSSMSEALEKAVELSKPDSVILVTGSLYLVGEAQQLLAKISQI